MAPSWTSWSGRVQATPRKIVRPRDEAEMAGAIRRARDLGYGLRVAGSGHSFTPLVATDGVLVSLEDWTGIESFDAVRLRATVRAGSQISSLGAPLRELGGALANQGDVDVQALGGAIGTGTHGTGRELGSLSTQATGMRLVTANGEVVEWRDGVANDAIDVGRGDLEAAAVSLGLLGIVSAITIQLVPPYRLHERTWRSDVDPALAELEANVGAHRHYEFWWYPGRDRIEHKSLDPTDAAPSDLPERKYERIDWSHRIFPTARDLRFNEMEYSLPASAGPACFRAVRARMRERHADVAWPVEYRTVAADRLWLSPAHGRDTVAISLHQGAELPCDDFFRDCEAIFRDHGGRPHWGKLHWRTPEDLARLYPMWERFAALRRKVDPEALFANEYLRGLFGLGGS